MISKSLVFLICISAVHNSFGEPIITAGMKSLNNSKSVRLGIGGIKLNSRLIILASVMMPNALTTSFALWAATCVIVMSLLLAVGLTWAKHFFHALLCPPGYL